MPVDWSKYPANWAAFSREIREREGQRCKWCKARNGVYVSRSDDGLMYMTADDDGNYRRWCSSTGESLGFITPNTGEWEGWRGAIKIVLTVAHLNADDGPCQCNPKCANPDHVVALCQRCHLRYDGVRHKRNRLRNRRAGSAVRDLFDTADDPDAGKAGE